MGDNDDIQDWEKFVKEIKITFSDKSKVANIEQKIKIFQQEKKHIADFMIKFEVLAIKAETDNMHTIFLLKKNVKSNNNIGIPAHSGTGNFEEMKGGNHFSQTRI